MSFVLYTVHIYYEGLLHAQLIELSMISVEHLARFYWLVCRLEKGRILYVLLLLLKTYNCIVFTNFYHTKLYSFQNLSLRFIFKLSQI